MEINKVNFLKLPNNPAVYTFWENKKPIYIGKSVNLHSRANSYLSSNLGIKTFQMVNMATDFSYILVNSDLESLLLESYLVKKYKPKYNILLKDDKHSLYIVITKEKFPRILAVRKITAETEKIIKSFGPFPSSYHVKNILKILRKMFPYSDHKLGKKPCLYSHIGLCNPCPNQIVTAHDRKIYIKNIFNIKLVLSRKFNNVRNSLELEMKNYSKNKDFEKALLIRDKIKTLDYITQGRVEEEKFMENPNLIQDIRDRELVNFKKILKTNNIDIENLDRIECFDIAHLSGSHPTASMVVAIAGELENKEYRHFKIQNKNSQSDYDSMREVAERRIKNIKNWGRPDLIIVDGGVGQVRVFNEKIEGQNIPIVGIAKHPDRLVFTNGVKVKLDSSVLNIVSRLRNEAHRFARRLHHKLITKSLLA